MTTAFAHPQDGMSPEDLMHYFIKVFNDENIPALEEVYHFPHVKIINGKLTRFDTKETPVYDFVGLKKTGWKYTKINQVKVLAEGANSALVELNFSRINNDNKDYFQGVAYYVLTKDMGYWQILCLSTMGVVPGVK